MFREKGVRWKKREKILDEIKSQNGNGLQNMKGLPQLGLPPEYYKIS
jgi:hypothetical protein